LASPLPLLALGLGAVLTIAGVYVCVSWYLFWNHNFRGQLITDGPYARVRHPFYAGFLALAFGVAMVYPILETLMLVFFSIAVIYVYVGKEEEYLLQRYGREYRKYMARVRWRLIPGVY